ncbi:Uncharacterised protein [Vibrio cholerae]|nr:Uncharacterised protein [Vibrio cholerae]CSA46201.1 Uncharacterised protein [Vibrio cholerae]CSB05099.1 Uncharacterised protein [Vibrio cholerae]CSB14530.1 Uncharacterised protein [Vibrio cholerae]CSB57283.1 Uncharacterised protein [Vibrio cholerae]
MNKRFVLFTKVLFINNETTTDRVVSFAEDFLVVDPCVNLHAVFVQRQISAVEIHPTFTRERDGMTVHTNRKTFCFFYTSDKARNRVDIHFLWRIACQTHDDSDIRVVTFPCQ